METNKIEWGKMSPKEIINKLEQMHRSRVYLIIRDELNKADIAAIMADDECKPIFQEIKMEAKKSWDHDHKIATMEDIDRACTVVYTTLLQLLKASHDSANDLMNTMCDAINRIEGKLDMELTDWGNNNDDVKGDTPSPQ